MANGYLEAKFESFPGNEITNPTLSTKEIFFPLKGANVTFNPTPLMRDDELRNQSDALAVVPDLFDPSITLTTPCYPDSLGFLLKQLMGAPVTTAGDGIITDPDAIVIPAGATRHVWTSPGGPAGYAPQTAQYFMVYKDQITYFRFKGVACSSLEFQIQDPEIVLVATMPALWAGTNTDPALSAAYESLAVNPFRRKDTTIPLWLSGSDNSFESLSVKIDNPVEKARTMGIASKFPDLMDKGDAPIVMSGDVALRHISNPDVAAMLLHTGFASKIKFGNDVNIGATSYKYTFWIEMTNTQYVAGDPDDLQNRRRHGAKFNWKATTSAVGTQAFKVTVVNGTGSYV